MTHDKGEGMGEDTRPLCLLWSDNDPCPRQVKTGDCRCHPACRPNPDWAFKAKRPSPTHRDT